MTKDYYLRSYLPGDEKQIVQLLKFAFDDWRLRGDKALDFWDWMYKGYNSNPSLIDVGVSDDRIIATNHRLPLRMKIGSKIVSGFYGTDMMVHPDFRGMGISSKIIKKVQEKMKNENLNFHYFYTDNPVMLKYNSKYYDLFPHTVSRYLRIQDISLHCRMKSTDRIWLLKLGYLFIKAINQIKNKKSLFYKQDFAIKEINCFDNRVNKFWREVSKNLTFIVEKTKGYLNWRYVDIPNHCYRILRAGSQHFVVFRKEIIKGMALAVIRIVESHCWGEASRRVFSSMMEIARKEQVVLIDFFCSAPCVGLELESLGFVQETALTSGIPRLFRPMHPGWPINVAIDFPPHRTVRSLA